jgi:lysophospholipase L1-like esterase
MSERVGSGATPIFDEDGDQGLIGWRDARGRNWMVPRWSTDAAGNVAGLVGPDGSVLRTNLATNSIVLFGDSITNYNGGPGTSAPEIYDSKGFFVWANTILGNRFRVISNRGVAGETTAQMLLRVQSDIIALNPQFVTILAGTNDLTANVPAATIIANLQAMYLACVRAGINVVAIPITPRTGLTGPQEIVMRTVNAWIVDYARTLPRMTVCNMGSAIADPATNWQPAAGLLLDVVHPNSAAAAAMGRLLAAHLDRLAAPFDFLGSGTGSSDNLLTNPNFNGSGGTVASGWGATGSPTISYVARTDGVRGNWMQVAVAADQGSSVTSNVNIGAALAIGETVIAGVEFQVDSLQAAPAANTQSFHLGFRPWNGSSFFAGSFAAYWDGSYVNFQYPGTSGIFVTPPYIVPATTTLMQVQINCNRGGNYRLGRAFVRKVTL